MDPAKAAGAFLSISEVTAATGVPAHVLRYWEGRLPQLSPLKRAGGRRFYRPEDVALVREVQRLLDREGFTLDGAAKALRRGSSASAIAAPRAHAASVATAPAGLVPQLRTLRDRLARALA